MGFGIPGRSEDVVYTFGETPYFLHLLQPMNISGCSELVRQNLGETPLPRPTAPDPVSSHALSSIMSTQVKLKSSQGEVPRSARTLWPPSALSNGCLLTETPLSEVHLAWVSKDVSASRSV